jgi:hypothetical protein
MLFNAYTYYILGNSFAIFSFLHLTRENMSCFLIIIKIKIKIRDIIKYLINLINQLIN